MSTLEGLTLGNYNTDYQFIGPFWVQTNQHIINGNFGSLKGSITTFTIIFGPFWVPIVITNKIFMPMLDLLKMQI